MSIVITVPVPRVVEVERSVNVLSPTISPRPLTVNTALNRLEVNPAPRTVSVEDQTRTVVVNAAGTQGPPGTSEGATFNAVAGETIFGGRAVRIENGLLYHPDTNVTAHADQVIGIAVQSGSVGSTLSVRSGGTFTEPSWTWGSGFIFCGNNGVLTQTPAATGWLMVVGHVVNPTSIDVDVDTAFHRG